jgi:hypothetical protein
MVLRLGNLNKMRLIPVCNVILDSFKLDKIFLIHFHEYGRIDFPQVHIVENLLLHV